MCVSHGAPPPSLIERVYVCVTWCPPPPPPPPLTPDDKTVEAKRAIPREATRDSSPPSSSSPQCKKVFLGGLSVDTEEKDIREVLEEIGPVRQPL